MKTAAELFRLICEREDARDYAARAQRSGKAIMKHLFDAKRRAFYGWFDFRGKPVKHDTPHTYALANVGALPEYDAGEKS